MPLWHTAMALVARLAGVDSAVVVQLAPAVLSPLVLVMVLGLGVALFRSRGAGLATAAGQLWLFGLANAGIGAFAILTGPATFSLLGLVPALLALAFTHLRSGRRVDLLSVAAAALVLTVVHPTYTIYAWLLLAAYGCARWLLADRTGTDLRRLGAVLAAAGAAAGLYLAWLAPVIASQPTVSPDAGEVERQLRVYAYQLDVHGSSYAMNPESLTRGGPATVLALAGLVVALLARRRRWAAFLLGASAVVLLITLVPALFTTVSDLVSISQARRIAAFLPAAVAVAAVAMVVGRLRVVGVVVGLGVGWALHRRYPGDFTYSMSQGGGPAWPVWLAAAVCLVAAAVLPWLRRRPGRGLRLGPGVWGAAVALALLVPSGVSGFDELKRHEPRTGQLTAGTLRALRDITPGDVVFADDRAAYDVAGYAPLYVNTAVEGHVWDRWQQRHDDAQRFFSGLELPVAQRERLLEQYDADYVLARAGQARRGRLDEFLDPVHADRRWVLYRVPGR